MVKLSLSYAKVCLLEQSHSRVPKCIKEIWQVYLKGGLSYSVYLCLLRDKWKKWEDKRSFIIIHIINWSKSRWDIFYFQVISLKKVTNRPNRTTPPLNGPNSFVKFPWCWHSYFHTWSRRYATFLLRQAEKQDLLTSSMIWTIPCWTQMSRLSDGIWIWALANRIATNVEVVDEEGRR